MLLENLNPLTRQREIDRGAKAADTGTDDHDRNRAGLRYVYPVVSRRAGGVSLGINLNVNNACNWRCIYCQVPDLKRGGPPPIDIEQLTTELRQMLTAIVHGDFLAREAPEGLRRLNDIAFSGNGEPTTAREFPACVERVGQLLEEFDLLGKIKLVLISNGSQMGKAPVQAALRRLAALNGEVWFKLDRATAAGRAQINDTQLSDAQLWCNLKACATACPTWIQTCAFRLDGQPPSPDEQDAYLDLLRRTQDAGLKLRGVMLYGLARPALQAEAPRLSALDPAWFDAMAARIEALGLYVRSHP
jgi:wyosine [tRNA(Phe)-imidazoG37] synthetase (radical SAM superfamily)